MGDETLGVPTLSHSLERHPIRAFLVTTIGSQLYLPAFCQLDAFDRVELRITGERLDEVIAFH